MKNGKIIKIAGPLVVASGMGHANMFDVVHVGKDKLIGEVIEMRRGNASIQVYEETAGLCPGDIVETTGAPLSVELGPGLISTIYDGIQRPLEDIMEKAGPNIPRGIQAYSIDREVKWHFVPYSILNETVSGGDIIGEVQETNVVTHKIMVPHGVSGVISKITEGDYTVEEPVCIVSEPNGEDHAITLMQKWPVRIERPYNKKLAPENPMITGQRVIDTLFPIAKGGTATVPGPFGSGKTVVQHQLAKWSNVDIVVYIGCGERGNEMTDVLMEFPELIDPNTGDSIMKRTILIANTSDMPVAAREASVYTGITIAEYYRDMGNSVVVIADSTSRWAEALREMSGRLEEMPGDEGYPAYLTSRLAQFYERAGRVECTGNELREGTLSAIGAVSPPGGDISEPVSQATLRIVKVFLGLDSSLAYARHFPAINWLSSYSLYLDRLKKWYDENLGVEFMNIRDEVIKLLQKENELNEIVRLVGIDALSPADRLIIEVSQIIREDFLQQNAFSDTDSYTPLTKQQQLLKLIFHYYYMAEKAIKEGADMEKVFSMEERNSIGRAKDVPPEECEKVYGEIEDQITASVETLISEGGIQNA